MTNSLTSATTAFLLAGLLTAGAIILLNRSGLAAASIDTPNHRSLHALPTARIGGLAMLLALIPTMLIWLPAGKMLAALFLAAALAAVSIVDDRINLPVISRLAAHIVTAGLLVYLWASDSAAPGNVIAGSPVRGSGQLLSMACIVLLLLALGWMTNLFNFMDGANGMAGGMAATGFATYAVAATVSPVPNSEIVLIGASIAGAACGFLPFNFPNARIFMGDAGSIPLGFLAAAIGIQGYLASTWSWWFGVLVFSPFIVDATTTLVRRLFQGKRVWQAHREHYYQRLILSGWSHQKTVASYYLLMLGSALSALFSLNSELVCPIAIFWVITYVLLIFSLEWRFHQEKKDKTRTIPGAK
ncbi:MAG: glycosyltransferase family 4 protein [Betaproteobacteria bacterium]|nr:glycosyltransferase family 4 protein [Betaproteobacteria bacterium]